jgi:hypothetical protein
MIGSMFSLRFVLVLVLLLFSTTLLAAPVQGGSMPVPLPLFPQNNWWNIDISHAPTVLDSTVYYGKMGGSNRGLHPDFGGESVEEDRLPGDVYGFPFIVVDGAQVKKIVEFTDAGDESDGVNHDTETSFPFYPIPDEAITQFAWIESGQPGNFDDRDRSDRHILIVDKTNNTLYELYWVWFNGAMWEAYSGAFFDMNTNNRRPEGWTSADAAGLAILPGLVRYDEVYGPDEIRHAFRVTMSSTNGHVYPASHTAGGTAGALPMGARLRLKESKNISSFPAPMQKIFRAFKKYGLIVADNGSNMYVSGTYDLNWDSDVLNPAFGALKVSDFEVIELGWKPSFIYVLSLPDVMGNGDAAGATLTVYDANYNVATGYTGTVHFTSTDPSATLPVDYTFTPGDAGVHTFTNGFTLRTAGSHVVTFADTVTLTVTGSKGVTVGPPRPVNLAATATTTTQVQLTWTASAGATQYEVVRGSNAPVVVGTNNYTDNTVTAGNAYLYKVRALDASSRRSPDSAPDLATTFVFTDDPVVAQTTPIKAIHITQLRQAVNAVRAAASLGSFTFTDISPTNIRAVHIAELRSALGAARTALGLASQTFTDPALTPGATVVKAAHVQELRAGVK